MSRELPTAAYLELKSPNLSKVIPEHGSPTLPNLENPWDWTAETEIDGKKCKMYVYLSSYYFRDSIHPDDAHILFRLEEAPSFCTRASIRIEDEKGYEEWLISENGNDCIDLQLLVLTNRDSILSPANIDVAQKRIVDGAGIKWARMWLVKEKKLEENRLKAGLREGLRLSDLPVVTASDVDIEKNDGLQGFKSIEEAISTLMKLKDAFERATTAQPESL